MKRQWRGSGTATERGIRERERSVGEGSGDNERGRDGRGGSEDRKWG